MDLNIASAVFGLLGAMLGAGVSIATTAMSNNAQVRNARQERVGRVVDAQRETYINFLSQGDLFLDLARELSAVLDTGAHEGDSRADATFMRYSAEWTKFVVNCAAVQISGPPDVANSANQLRLKIGAWSELIDRRYTDGKRWRGHDEAVDAARMSAREARAEFIHHAQSWLTQPKWSDS